MIRLVQKGHPDFAAGLRRRATGINQATMHSGPRHALHDNAPYIAVRKAASELSTILFDTEKEADTTGSSMDSAGYGVNKSKTTMEGFGNTQPAQEKTFTDQIKNGIQQLTESFSAIEDSTHSDCSGKVYKAIPSSTSKSYPNKSTNKGSLIGNTPDVGTAAGRREDVKKSTKNKVVQNPDLARIIYKGGKAGGGWEDDGSSDGVSSGHSNGSEPWSEKLESAVVEDWNQEANCVEDIVGSREGRLIPSRQELDQLERRCNTLNCDQVLEFLIQKITNYDSIIQMRALCAIERLLNTDLLGLVSEMLHGSLQTVVLAESSSKQAVSKAKKILRQIQNAVKQEELRNEPKNASYAGQDLITTTSNESVCNDLKDDYNLQKGLPTNFNESGQKNAIVDDHIGHKSDKFSVSLFDGLMMKPDDSENGSNNTLKGTKEIKANTLGNNLPIGAQVLDLLTEQNTVGNSRIVGNSVMTTSVVVDDSNVKESNSCSREPCGGTRQPQYKESTKDPLLSSDNNIDYLLASMNFKVDSKKVVSSATNDKIVMNQTQTTLLPQRQQSLDKDRITAMFPQLSTSTLSGSSAIPLQLGKDNTGSFGFITQTNTRSKPKPKENFDFVQEAMKSAIPK
ncbi:AP-4 complex accessory subunit Tepsin-like isoform X2 [Anneissia japonica]|nr:AP-4 complex accessory subunit Tepsin-like isoform X2 [Anneissia japonica]